MPSSIQIHHSSTSIEKSTCNILLAKPAPVALWCILSFAVFLLALCAYGQSLASYFFNDDFVLLAYFQEVALKNPVRLLDNFVQPWMDHRDVFIFYRPWTVMTIALDFFIWRENAFGYHLSTLLCHAASGIALMFVAYKLLPFYPENRRILASFLSGALFVCFPIFLESLGCVLTRSDPQATWMMLLCILLLFQVKKNKSKLALAASVVLFTLSISSKEIAAIVPGLAILICLFDFGTGSGVPEEKSIKQRIKSGIKLAIPFCIMLGLHLCARFYAMGTILGGYVGSFDIIIKEWVRNQWMTRPPFETILFPFNRVAYPSDGVERTILEVLYIAVAALVILTFNKKKAPAMVFFLAWALSYLACVGPIWANTETLIGARLAYSLMVPLAALMAVCVIPTEIDHSHRFPKNKILTCVGVFVLSAFVVLFSQLAVNNFRPWLAAADEEISFRRQCEEELRMIPADRKMAVLNLPRMPNGCTSVLCAEMWQTLMRKPFSSENWDDRTVAPYQHPLCNPFVNTTVLRRFFSEPNRYQIYRWNSATKTLSRIITPMPESPIVRNNLSVRHLGSFGYYPETKPIADAKLFSNSMRGTAISSYLLEDKQPGCTVAYDYLEMEIRSKPTGAKRGSRAEISWNTVERCDFNTPDRVFLDLQTDGRTHTYRLPITQNITWNSGGPVAAIRVDLPLDGFEHTLESAVLKSGESEVPSLKLATESTATEAVDASWEVRASQQSEVSFAYDASQVKGASKVIAQISKPYFYYEYRFGYRNGYRNDEFTMKTIELKPRAATFTVPLADFPKTAKYEVRVAAVDGSGNIVESFSDPVLLSVFK